MNDKQNEFNQIEDTEKEFPNQGNFSASSNNHSSNFQSPKPNPSMRNPLGFNKYNPNIKPSFNGNQINKGKNGTNGANQAQQAKQQMAKEAAKMAANAALGPAGAKAVEALSKTKMGKKLLNKAGNFDPMKKLNPFSKDKEDEEEAKGEGDIATDIAQKVILFTGGSSFGLSGCFSFVLVVCVISIIIAPLLYMDELIESAGEGLSNFGERLGNFLIFRGWCTDSECEEIEKNNFYESIEEVYDDYREEKNVILNTSLLTATLTYIDPFVTTNSDGEEVVPIEDMESSNLIDFKKSEKKVKLLAEKMVKQNESGIWELDLDGYRTYLEDEFVRKFYYDNKEGTSVDNKVKQTVNEIFARAEFYEGSKPEYVYTKTYAYCSGVTVTNPDGSILGTYSLEDYIAGVVSAETMAGLNPEAYKAQAVAARTATLKFTNNCERTIENSTRNQVFKWPAYDYGIEAAEATKGQVMIYDGAIFDTQYDSYCYNDKDCEYGEEDGKMYVIYKRLPTEETHKVYLSHDYDMHVNGGHGRGMSQAASYEMADNGYTYEEILKFFYSDGATLANMITVVGSEHISTSSTIADKEDLLLRSNYYSQLGKVNIAGSSFNLANIYSQSAGNLGQCVWYAQSRALELIYYSNMDDLQKIKALNAISSTYRNGEGWYDASTLDIFQKVTDYTLPVAGAIVSWSSSESSGASHNYGHVAIIESVDYENRTVVISDGWNSEGPNGSETWENVNYRIRTLTFEEILNYRTGYTFNGYVYILGQGESI